MNMANRESRDLSDDNSSRRGYPELRRQRFPLHRVARESLKEAKIRSIDSNHLISDLTRNRNV